MNDELFGIKELLDKAERRLAFLKNEYYGGNGGVALPVVIAQEIRVDTLREVCELISESRKKIL